MLNDLKARFPKLFPTVVAVVALGGVGSYAAYERLSADCCHAGASCCHQGAACCARHKLAQQ
ncbi:MAG TPA: hypothetical protein VM580_03460 [Labilithrix sp.]|nr:hypothetical protein [Labilithrix sp.]